MRSETIYFDFEFPQLMTHVIECQFDVFFFLFSLPLALQGQKRLNVRVSKTLFRSPKRNLFDECIVIILTKAVHITSIHSLPSTVNHQLISYGGMVPVRHITALGSWISVNWNVSFSMLFTKQNGLFIVRLFGFVLYSGYWGPLLLLLVLLLCVYFGCCFAFICISL